MKLNQFFALHFFANGLYCNDLTLIADKHLLNNESEMCVGPTADSPLRYFLIVTIETKLFHYLKNVTKSSYMQLAEILLPFFW